MLGQGAEALQCRHRLSSGLEPWAAILEITGAREASEAAHVIHLNINVDLS